MKDETVRYLAAITCLTVLAAAALIFDGDIGEALVIPLSGAIGYMVKDWRVQKKVSKNAEEVPQ